MKRFQSSNRCINLELVLFLSYSVYWVAFEWNTFLFFGAVAAIIYFNKKQSTADKNEFISYCLEEIDDFSPDVLHYIKTYNDKTLNHGFALAFDEQRKKVALLYSNEENEIYHYVYSNKDVFQADLIEDGICQASVQVGGPLTGGTGAIAGAMVGSNSINDLSVRLMVNDLKNPIHTIPFIKEKIKKTSTDYRKDKMKAEKLYGIFNILIKQIEKNIEN